MFLQRDMLDYYDHRVYHVHPLFCSQNWEQLRFVVVVKLGKGKVPASSTSALVMEPYLP